MPETEIEIMKASGCPVSHTDYTTQRPLFETYALLDAERDRGPFLWNDTRKRPFWMIIFAHRDPSAVRERAAEPAECVERRGAHGFGTLAVLQNCPDRRSDGQTPPTKESETRAEAARQSSPQPAPLCARLAMQRF